MGALDTLREKAVDFITPESIKKVNNALTVSQPTPKEALPVPGNTPAPAAPKNIPMGGRSPEAQSAYDESVKRGKGLAP